MKFTRLLILSICIPAVAVAGSDVFIPATSIESPFDRGIRAHTNYRLYTGPSRFPRLASPPFSAMHVPFESPSFLAPPDGYYPEDIRAAYNLPAIGGSGAIAVIDAYDYASSLNDFNVFSHQFALRGETSSNATSATNLVFQVVYQGSTKPTADAGWGQESALDIEWAHSMAPYAKIYLVEANSSGLSDLFAAVQKAETLPGVREISMSFGSGEFAQELTYDSIFQHPGIVFFAAAGDTAATSDYPCLSPNVVDVGGTSLVLSSNDIRENESAWNSTGGGPSAYEPIPSYQSGIASIVGAFRGGPDMAFCADPQFGCAVYDSTPYQGFVGWLVAGGTSLATPCCAGVANLSNRRSGSSATELTRMYGGLGENFRDITTGTSGRFSAKPGWDFTTGVGVPIRTESL